MRQVEKVLPGVVDAHHACATDLANRLTEVDADRARAEIRRLHGPAKAERDGDKVRLKLEDDRFEAVLIQAYRSGPKPGVTHLPQTRSSTATRTPGSRA